MKYILLIVLALWSIQVKAQAQLVMGQEQPVQTAFCSARDDAIAVAKMDSEKGIAAARAVMMSKDCGFAQAMVRPTRVVYTGKTERGSTVRAIEVTVEMSDNSYKTFFMIVDCEVIGLTDT